MKFAQLWLTICCKSIHGEDGDTSRSSLIFLAAGLLAGAALAEPGAAQMEPVAPSAGGAHVNLLGTCGGPAAKRTRSQPASLLQVGDKSYLIDAGDGVLRQLATIGVQPNAIDAVFITHLHFDHTAGLPAFMAFDLLGRRTAPVAVYGPPGTRDFVRDAIKLFKRTA